MGKDHNIIAVISAILILVILYILFSISKTGEMPKDTQPSFLCEKNGWNWVENFNECETSDALAEIKEFCEKQNGEFNECASPCRHSPETEICASVCVQVCSF